MFQTAWHFYIAGLSRLASILVPSGTTSSPIVGSPKQSGFSSSASSGAPLGTFSPIASPLALLPVLFDSSAVDHATPVQALSDGHHPGSTGPGGSSGPDKLSVYGRDNRTNPTDATSSHLAPSGGGPAGGVGCCSVLTPLETNQNGTTVVMATHPGPFILPSAISTSESQGKLISSRHFIGLLTFCRCWNSPVQHKIQCFYARAFQILLIVLTPSYCDPLCNVWFFGSFIRLTRVHLVNLSIQEFSESVNLESIVGFVRSIHVVVLLPSDCLLIPILRPPSVSCMSETIEQIVLSPLENFPNIRLSLPILLLFCSFFSTIGASALQPLSLTLPLLRLSLTNVTRISFYKYQSVYYPLRNFKITASKWGIEGSTL